MILCAFVDCCSTSYFILPTNQYDSVYNYDLNINSIIGKILLNICDVDNDIIKTNYDIKEYLFVRDNLKHSHAKYHYYIMEFSDETFYTFMLINYSNGYYDGCYVIRIVQDFVCTADSDLDLTIAVGLLGSGKTYYIKEFERNYKNDNLLIFDDVMTNIFPLTQALNMNNKTRIIVNNPCFCDPLIFKSFVNMLITIKCNHKIDLILFANNPINCIKNIISREKNEETAKQIINSLDKLMKIYNINNEEYNKYNVVTKRVIVHDECKIDDNYIMKFIDGCDNLKTIYKTRSRYINYN